MCFTGPFPELNVVFFPCASANLERKPQTGGADIFLACCIALQPAHVKKGNGFK